MIVGVDATCWANGRGYGRFTRELLRAMSAAAPTWTFVCFVDARARAQFDLVADNVRLVEVAQSASPTDAAAADGSRSPFDMLRLTRAVFRTKLDVFFSPSVYTYFPLPPGLRTVVTVHDAIADRFPELTLPSRRARLFWRAKVSLALWQARRVLTVSDYAANDIADVLGVPRSRIRVAVEAPSAIYTPSPSCEVIRHAAARAGLPDGARWFIYVGGFNPHKNVDLLVRAHARLVRDTGPLAPYLVLVGTLSDDVFHGAQADIRRAIAEEGTSDRIIWTGFVADEDLRHLHSGALALALPSTCEGFGLPAVEAAACGTPVVATTASPLPRLLEGGGLFVDPGDLPALASALATLAGDETTRLRLAACALSRARALSWTRSAEAAIAALEEAVA
jgi:glycosyltransferase involved in cell wall biosynthesis